MSRSAKEILKRRNTDVSAELPGLELTAGVFRDLIEAAPDAMVIVDAGGRIVLVNTQTEKMFGWEREELLGKQIEMLIPERFHKSHVEQRNHYSQSPHVRNMGVGNELFGRRKDGTEFPVDVSLSPLKTSAGVLMSSAIRDVTDRKGAEESIKRLNRVHAVLTGITSLIVRVRNRQELFAEACRIAVEQGHFKLAWIGLTTGDEVRPAAVHGIDNGYVDSSHITLRADSPLGHGPTARALRERRSCIINDIANDPDMAPWRDAAIQRGFAASIACPLMVGNQVVGSFNLYAGEVGFFDDEEVKLLSDLARDISYAMEFIAREEKLDYLAYYDPLTRLANRTLFIERLNQFVQMARIGNSVLAVLIVDLERFRSVNDTLGMAAGDELLLQVAGRLTTFAGGANYLARIGSNMFAVVVPLLKQASDLSDILRDRMWAPLDQPYMVGSQELRISERIGIAVFPEDGDDGESLLRNAESALKSAKTNAERYLFYTRQMSAVLKEKLKLETGLRRALEQREFLLMYQPKVDLRSGAICGAEALIRWNSPELGLVPPAKFITLLEETGMIIEVGKWVVQQAVADYHLWQAALVPAVRIAVNVSALQLRQADFVETFSSLLLEHAGQQPGIDLEVTESMVMSSVEENVEKLRRLRELGVGISIDDFGTGYSSLSYLNKLPINSIKIDRSFIVNMTASADTLSMVSTIISLAHSLQLQVIAEGVDSQEQLKFLRLLRCDEIQGYLFSKPLPVLEFAQLLREDRRLPLP